MLKTNQVLTALAAVALSVGLTGCGKDNYQGTYQGFEQLSSAQTAQTGQNGQPIPQYNYNYQNNQANMVTLTLTNNGDAVTGTYSVTQSYGNMYQTPMNMGNTTSQFTASSENSGSLSNVMLYRNVNGMACLYTGTLTSSNHGQTITGTLSSPSANQSGAWGASCSQITLNLTRGN